MSDPTTDAPPPDPNSNPMAKADLIAGIVFLVFGLTVFYLAWDMPRLENRRIHPSTIPGLVPMLLGGALTLCGFLLSLAATRTQPLARGWDALGGQVFSVEASRVVILLGLVLVYTLVLIGLVPFWLATGLFVFSFIVLFETVLSDRKRPLVRSIIWAAVQAVIVAAVVTFVFERGFLVRLP